jgi:ABC-type lipoprotein export system ATPase subunit
MMIHRLKFRFSVRYQLMILADGPMGWLDTEAELEIARLLHQNAEEARVIVVASHDSELVC